MINYIPTYFYSNGQHCFCCCCQPVYGVVGADHANHLSFSIETTLWRRYVDDCYEKTKQGTYDRFTEHPNQVDLTGNIKVTFEGESEGALSMLDTESCRAEGGSLEVRVYCEKTHTDQYLN